MPRIIREWSALRGENNAMAIIMPIVMAPGDSRPRSDLLPSFVRVCDIYVKFNKLHVDFVNKGELRTKIRLHN